MSSIFDTPPPPVFTRDGRDGFPAEVDFEGIMAEYIDGLNPRKRDKALMTQAMYDTILIILTNPHDTRCATAQFRFWTKKMFRLVTTAHAHIVTHENRPVAVKEQIYDVLVQCHQQCSHGGRDKTSNQVRRYYSWIPKELIARFVKACPLCNARRNAKGGGGGSSTNLAALGPDGSSSLTSGSSSVGDSSSPSEASTSSDSAVTTPSRQMRPLSMPHSNSMPFTPGSYLASAMYHGMPMSATSNSSSLPPMPSPSHNPQDWTQWVNNTPQRAALSQSVGSNGSVGHGSVQQVNGNPTLHFAYHTGAPAHIQNTPATHTISLQTPPHSASQTNDQSHSGQMQQQILDEQSTNSNTTMSHGQLSGPSAETQAYYSQLMQQTMASFLQAPPMTSQWSSDSVTTVSSCTSASSRSSSELEDLTDSAANSPLPPLPSDQGKDGASNAFQQQIDNLTAHLGGVNAHGLAPEDEEEASFQSFMSSFKTTQQVEQDQIDPLLRAMNVDVMNGMPLVGENALPTVPLAPTPILENNPTALQQSPAKTKKKASPAPLGGNTFKFPPAPGKAEVKKNDKKNAKNLGRKGSKGKAHPKDPKNAAAPTFSRTDSNTGNASTETQQAVPPTASTPDLSAYFQLQNTFNQMRDGFASGGNTPALGSNTSYTSNQGQQGTPAAQWQGVNGNENLSQSMASSAHAEFSFNVSDMSADVSTTHTNDTFNVNTAMASNTMDNGNDGKTRPRPPQLDFSSFSNNNAFSPAGIMTTEQDLHASNDNSYLTAFQYPSNEFNQSTSGSISAPAHITQFTQPEVPIITPDVPLFNYEQQMNMNFSFVGNSFVDYGGTMGMDQYGLPSATSPDIHYDYSGNNGNQSLHPQGQEVARPASAAGYLEPHAYGSPENSMAQQQQQHMSLMPAIHSAPLYHLPMSSQQQQAQARELSEQIQAILDSAVPTNDAHVEQVTTAGRSGRPSRKR